MSEFSLIIFFDVFDLRGIICPKVINFFNDFITFNLRATKRQTRVTIFLSCKYAGVESIFQDCFHQSITYVVTYQFCFVILENPQHCYDIKEKLIQNRYFVFIVFCNIFILHENDVLIRKKFYLIKKAQTNPKISYYLRGLSHLDPKKTLFYFFEKV